MYVERLSLLGGGGQWLNLHSAMKIAGFAGPELIYDAIRKRSFKVNEKMCDPDDPTNKKWWVRIETESFLQWLEVRSSLEVGRVYRTLDGIAADQLLQFGLIKRESALREARFEREIILLRQEIARLSGLLIDNLRVKKDTLRIT